jgi:hypothetical protein
MATPVWKLQRMLRDAQARETYLSTERPSKTTYDAQPRKKAVYTPLLLKVGAEYPKLLLSISEAALTFFGGATALGLSETPTDLADAVRAPRNFRPSKLMAMVGDGTPAPKKAYGGTGPRYIDYSGNTAGNAQAHFTAPISCGDQTPTYDQLRTKANAIRNAKLAALGSYGRLDLILEVANVSLV